MRLSRWAHRIPGLADHGFYETLCRASFCVVLVTILAQRIFVGELGSSFTIFDFFILYD